jgi:hypothetical protein
MQDDRPPRRGKGRRRGKDQGRGSMPGMDSGFFTTDGFEAELDPGPYYDNSTENTALNNMDPIREAQLFEQFEQDYRSGGYDPGPDPRDMSGYRAATESGYREPDYPPSDRPRHGKNRDRRRANEGGPRIPMFARKNKPAARSARSPAQPPARSPARPPRSARAANQHSPFGDLTPYLVPMVAAVAVVMVIVVLLLNR